tara:strand:- start:525 stop:899 length:375 start_codon:yes stop_codon:yes gene_type:complete
MISELKELGFKTAPTLNQFVKKTDDVKLIKQYNNWLSKVPKRTDFISFDNEGYALNDNTPLFKGWVECLEASSEKIKVAKLEETRMYFDTKDGVIVVNLTNMCDQTTYNDLFIFFEGKLKLNDL